MKIDVDELIEDAESYLTSIDPDPEAERKVRSWCQLQALARVGAAAVENHKLLAAWDGKRDNKGMVDSVAAGERLHIEVQKYLTAHPEGARHEPRQGR